MKGNIAVSVTPTFGKTTNIVASVDTGRVNPGPMLEALIQCGYWRSESSWMLVQRMEKCVCVCVRADISDICRHVIVRVRLEVNIFGKETRALVRCCLH
jgi:hypothetical protein